MLEHSFTGQLSIVEASTTITIEVDECQTIQDHQGQRVFKVIVRCHVAVNITEWVSWTMYFCLLEAEFHQELEEVLCLKMTS